MRDKTSMIRGIISDYLGVDISILFMGLDVRVSDDTVNKIIRHKDLDIVELVCSEEAEQHIEEVLQMIKRDSESRQIHYIRPMRKKIEC